nr:immunoglobulin light chain junction region [Macaca mulatta]MOV72101.1 immunoglobulin light chain junction region [Macaca mulatta]MOV72115.1 immunoglobulin light chain junction region [Macaca mulatta]MOV72153.1 immunoglobulin light chain junction region [Macaca mulatta]MOV72191.1 immunoglobulin light chain junction region [Macaca mulatta]
DYYCSSTDSSGNYVF